MPGQGCGCTASFSDKFNRLFVEGYITGIVLCMKHNNVVSALALAYAAIDSAASLTAPASATVRQRYVDWLDKFMMPDNTVGCSSLEIYSARCGVLHTQTAESDLTRQQGVRKVYYYVETVPSIPPHDKTKEVFVCVNVLLHELAEALDTFRSTTAKDPNLRKRASERLRKMFTWKPADWLKKLGL